MEDISTREYSHKQEKKIAKQVGAARPVANSGATPFNKGDVDNGRILFDGKTCITEQKSVAIKKADLEKIKEEAFAMGRDMGVLVFDFGAGGNLYYVLGEKDFKQMLEAYNDKMG